MQCLAINSAFDSLLERKQDFDATAVKEAFQVSVETQMTQLKRLDIHIEDMQSRIGIDVAKSSMLIVSAKRYHHSGVSGTIVSLEAVPL